MSREMLIDSRQAQALVLDDHPVVAEALRRILGDGEITAHVAAGEPEALSLLRRSVAAARPIDLVTTDIRHPGGDGLSFIREIRGLPDWGHELPL